MNRENSEHWSLKNSNDLCCIVEIPVKKIFFSQNFWNNQNSRKNEIQFFNLFHIGIERPLRSDAKKILLTFVVLSKSGRKVFFFYQNFWTNRNLRKNQIQLFDFFLIEIERPMNTDGKKSCWPFLYSRNPREKNFFLLKFFDQSEFEKNEFQLFQFFPIGIERWVNTDAE